jgi:predicted transglutaminase-like cysteine proteinase
VQSDGVVSYTGTGTYRPGEDVIVGAVLEDGYVLSGWQVDGKPFARSTDVVISGLHEDTEVRAVAVASSAAIVDLWSTVTVSDGSGTPSTRWTIADAHNGDSPVGAAVGEPAEFIFTVPGEYRITNGDTGTHRYVIADGDVSGTVTFAYGRTLSTVTWTVPFSHYAMYKDDAAKRAHTDHDSDSMFITWMDGDIRALADTITGRVLGHAPANSEESLLLADATLAFTQYAVRYQSDKEAHGATEYWKYPIETLVDGKGDCEDSAALFTALTAAMGLDSLMILHLPSAGDGHAFSGIAADADGVSYSIDGKKYLYCETTGIGYTVGIMPDGKRYIATRVIHPMRAR